MTTCASIQERVAGLAALPPGDPERAAAWEHARTCPGCARAIREAERLQALLADARPAPMPPHMAARVSRLVADLDAGDRRRIAWSAVAACAATVLLVALGRQRSDAARDWVLAAALAAVAAGLVALTRRLSLPVAVGALAAAAVAAAVAGRAGSLEAGLGLHCVGLELASMCAVVGAGWIAARRSLASIGHGFVVGSAAAGALAADAALHLTCRAHASLPHLLAFHLGGVLAAAVLAGVASWVAASAPR